MLYITIFFKLILYFLVGVVIYFSLLPLVVNTIFFYFVFPIVIVYLISAFFMIKYFGKHVLISGSLFILFGALSYYVMSLIGFDNLSFEYLEKNYLLIGFSSLLCIFEVFSMYNFIYDVAYSEAIRHRKKQLKKK